MSPLEKHINIVSLGILGHEINSNITIGGSIGAYPGSAEDLHRGSLVELEDDQRGNGLAHRLGKLADQVARRHAHQHSTVDISQVLGRAPVETMNSSPG